MNAAHKTMMMVLAASLTLAAAGCKNSKDTGDAPNDPNAPIVNDGIVFREGFSEQTIPGRLQADRPASDLSGDCTGFIAHEPTAEIRFDGDAPARIHVVAEVDTILAIDGPDGVLCNDNFDGYNPSLARSWKSGQYRIYVGSAEATDGPFDYDLNFDHYDPRRPLEPTPIAVTPDTDSAEDEAKLDALHPDHDSKALHAEDRAAAGDGGHGDEAQVDADEHKTEDDGAAGRKAQNTDERE